MPLPRFLWPPAPVVFHPRKRRTQAGVSVAINKASCPFPTNRQAALSLSKRPSENSISVVINKGLLLVTSRPATCRFPTGQRPTEASVSIVINAAFYCFPVGHLPCRFPIGQKPIEASIPDAIYTASHWFPNRQLPCRFPTGQRPTEATFFLLQ